MSASYDYAAGGEAGYTGLDGDRTDSAQMQPFSAAPEGVPWWQGVIAYGLTRAIDNRYAPVNVQGNTSPGSFAGANGKTYSNAQPGVMAGPWQLSTVLLVAGVAVVVLLMAKS